MRIAAIDLGSNSFHMVVVEVNASGGFHVVAAEKKMVRLGAGTVARGRLSAAAMRQGLEVLREYKRLAEAQGAEKILAVATSAIREAANGEEFLRRVGREIRIWPRAITGETEARFIYLAALHSIHLEGQRALVLRERLVAADLHGRLKLPGIDAQRADIIVAGAVILDTILACLGAKELVLCEWALREELLLHYIHGHPRTLARAEAYPDVRRRSVVALAERCEYDEAHARHVAGLALSLFDQTAHRYGLGATARTLLEHAALLHRPPQAQLLPDQERGPAGLPSRGDRAPRQHRPLPPPGAPR